MDQSIKGSQRLAWDEFGAHSQVVTINPEIISVECATRLRAVGPPGNEKKRRAHSVVVRFFDLAQTAAARARFPGHGHLYPADVTLVAAAARHDV